MESSDLNEDDKTTLKNLLLKTCEDFEKPISTLQGQGGHFRLPSFIESIKKINKQDLPKKKKIRLLCIPYFSLEKYTSRELPSGSSGYPVRSLLQLSYPFDSRERDMQQATALAGTSSEGCCFHVPQLWSLVIENSAFLFVSLQMDHLFKFFYIRNLMYLIEQIYLSLMRRLTWDKSVDEKFLLVLL